jgi:hypothetical protein
MSWDLKNRILRKQNYIYCFIPRSKLANPGQHTSNFSCLTIFVKTVLGPVLFFYQFMGL